MKLGKIPHLETWSEKIVFFIKDDPVYLCRPACADLHFPNHGQDLILREVIAHPRIESGRAELPLCAFERSEKIGREGGKFGRLDMMWQLFVS